MRTLDALHGRSASHQDPIASLANVLDAYQVFCNLGWHHVAWTNLYISLDGYLVNYFQREDGELPITILSMRIRYLANLTIQQFGDVACDTVYALLRQGGVGAVDERDTPPRSLLLSMNGHSLHDLLLDITKELGERSSLSNNRPLGVRLGSLSRAWCPSLGSDWRIAHTLINLLSNETPFAPVSPRYVPENEQSEKVVSVFDTPRRLLRRALSARVVGSGTRHRKPAALVREPASPSTEDFTAPTFSANLRVKPANLGDSVQSYAHAPEVEVQIASPARSSTESISHASSTSFDWQKHSKAADGQSSTLEAVAEKDEPSSTGTQDDELEYERSLQSSQTLDSLLDFYGRSSLVGTSHKSAISHSRRSSIDVAELGRADYTNLEFPNPVREQRLSFLSVARFSARSGITSITRHSFVTAESHLSIPKTKVEKRMSSDSFVSTTTPDTEQQSSEDGPYHSLLLQRNLLSSPMVETDWSGRGQHVEYDKEEEESIPLQVEKILGETRNALVESVQCRRIRLVRKTLRCTKWTGIKLEDALNEVQHLYRVQHSHIVRLVGTYVIGPNLSILTYPCAEWNLEQFMRDATIANGAKERCNSLRQFFTCLAKVLDFMHSFPLKHMDIKPANLLVRSIRHSTSNDLHPFKIYVTDFGISRSYESLEESETETPTSFTRAYAAKEVVLQESRGLSADIFSLGCVYAEMLAVVLDESTKSDEDPSCWDNLLDARGKNDTGFRAYHLATEDVRTWLSKLAINEPELDVIREWTYNMLDADPTQRPSAQHIAHDPQLPFPCSSCTLRTGPEDFEVAEPLLDPPPPT